MPEVVPDPHDSFLPEDGVGFGRVGLRKEVLGSHDIGKIKKVVF